VAIYLRVLPRLDVRTPECYGLVEADEDDLDTLFLEDAGERSYSPSSSVHRELMGRWLAQLHHAFDLARFEDSGLAQLPNRMPAYYRALLEKSRAAISAWDAAPDAAAESERATLLSLFEEVENKWAWIEECCARVQAVLVHTDLSPANIRMHQAPDGSLAPLVFDWDQAGIGQPVVDLDGRVLDLDAYLTARRRYGDEAELPPPATLTQVATILYAVDKNAWVGDYGNEWWKDADDLQRYSTLLVEGLRGTAGLC